MVRLFIGIPLPSVYQDALPGFTRSLKTGDAKVRWSRKGNWHLTLKFLGETDESRIPAIRAALAAITFPAFTMQAGGYGAFPNLRRPGVLWLGLKQGADQATELAGIINDTLAAIDIPQEKKRFRPHLTIGWVKKPGRTDWAAALGSGKRHWPQFTVGRFILWQSVLESSGAVHSRLAEFSLG